MSELVTIKTSSMVSNLAVAMSYLESENIYCFIKNEYSAMLQPFFSNNSGAQLQVREEDVPRAIQLLIEGGFARAEDYEGYMVMAQFRNTNMLDITRIKGIIFDYGGTIDSNGKHWAEVLWQAYEDNKAPVTKQQFREAYVYAERYLATHPVIQPDDNFGILLKKKVDLQVKYLTDKGSLKDDEKSFGLSVAISDQCYNFAKQTVESEKDILAALKQKYSMVLVSNFYGNVHAVLEDFDLLKYFDNIIESAVVGVRKPDPAIFGLGVKQLGFPADEIVVIGDSYAKDIVPATQNGCKTIWLKGPGWEKDDDEATADIVITDFKELKDIFQLN